jgi:hypothetical protein
MSRRPLRQLLREARDAEKGRRAGAEDFSRWLSGGVGKQPDERTKEALFHFEAGVLSIEYDFPLVEDPADDEDPRDHYNRTLAELTLSCIHHCLEQDKTDVIRTIAFDGYIETIDLSTGRDIRPNLIHLEVDRNDFEALDLTRVDPVACLRGLGAMIESAPFWAV